MPSISTRKRKFLYGSVRAMFHLLGSAPCLLLDAEHNKFSRFDDGDADFRDHLALCAHVRGVGRCVAAHVEGLLRRVAEKRAVAPLAEQKIADGSRDALPER